MSKLIGDVKVFKATEKQYEDRKYFTCLGMDKDNDIYKFSAPYPNKPTISLRSPVVIILSSYL